MPTARKPVLYVIGCGAPPTADLPDLVHHAQAIGWDVCAVLTPMGTRFVDVDRLAAMTGRPVRSEYKNPGDPDSFPPPDALVITPATFNTVNKIANGISDTLAVGLACEALGAETPLIIAPWQNLALTRHPTYARSISQLQESHADLIFTSHTQPHSPRKDGHGNKFPWHEIYATTDHQYHNLALQ